MPLYTPSGAAYNIAHRYTHCLRFSEGQICTVQRCEERLNRSQSAVLGPMWALLVLIRFIGLRKRVRGLVHLTHSCTQTLIILKVIKGVMMNERRERKHSLIFKRRHRRVTVSLDENQVIWLDMKVGERLFHSRSHGIEVAIRELRQQHAKNDKHI